MTLNEECKRGNKVESKLTKLWNWNNLRRDYWSEHKYRFAAKQLHQSICKCINRSVKSKYRGVEVEVEREESWRQNFMYIYNYIYVIYICILHELHEVIMHAL